MYDALHWYQSIKYAGFVVLSRSLNFKTASISEKSDGSSVTVLGSLSCGNKARYFITPVISQENVIACASKHKVVKGCTYAGFDKFSGHSFRELSWQNYQHSPQEWERKTRHIQTSFSLQTALQTVFHWTLSACWDHEQYSIWSPVESNLKKCKGHSRRIDNNQNELLFLLRVLLQSCRSVLRTVLYLALIQSGVLCLLVTTGAAATGSGLGSG